MRLETFRSLSVASLLVAILTILSLPAFANVGRVLISIGNVSVETPDIKELRRGAILNAGDVVVTGPRAMVQLKLVDGTKIAIRPNSRFIVEELEAPATATTPAIGAGGTLKASFNLQKGGFRTITGRIAKRNPSAYRLTTPTAVIRVRGTNFVTRICSADCAGTDDGLYVGVSNGGITMENDAGSLDLGKNQYGYAASANTAPTRLIAPPANLTDDGLALVEEESDDEDSEDDGPGDSTEGEAGEEGGSGEEGSSDGDSSDGGSSDGSTGDGSSDGDRAGAPPPPPPAAQGSADSGPGPSTDVQPEQVIETEDGEDLTDGETVFAARAMAFSDASQSSGFDTNNETITFDAEGALVFFDQKQGEAGTVKFDLGSGSNRNVGTDSVSGLKWGRWTAGTSDNTGDAVDLSNQSLHWIVGASDDQIPDQVITGAASYTLVGNTDPTDNLGHTGILGSASFSADFTNNTVNSSLQLGINNQVWSASGDGTITKQFFNGNYGSVTVDGASGGTGSFNGIFGGFNGANVPKGAGLTYQLNNGSTSVNGSATFNNTSSSEK